MLSNRISFLTAPPRRVPLPVVCSALLGRTGILGAIFLIMGLLSTWLFTSDFRPTAELWLALSTATAQGTVTGVNETNATENDTAVVEYHFTFVAPNEQTIAAHSYHTGWLYSPGDRVSVQYVPDEPTIARLEGTRLSTFSPWALFVVIFPIVGAAFFAASTIGGLRQVMLLRYGEVAGARTLSQRTTNTTINDVPVMKYTYEFQAKDWQTYSGTSRALPSEHIGDEAEEPVLYMPSNPKLSTLVDALPLRYPLDVGDDGQWIAYENVWPVVWYGLIWAGIIALVTFGLLRTRGSF
jgi:hypothetical protein